MRTLFPVLTLLAATLVTGVALAEKADRSKPMNIEADALRYDDVKQVSVFSGHVVLTKGSIVIRGAQVEVRQDAEGYQYGLITGDSERAAFFRQKREALDEFIEGEGQSIEYDGKADTVKFIRKASLRRFRGSVLGDEVTGALIVYENLSDMFTVDGSTAKDPGVARQGRVRAMLTPPKTQSGANPPAGAGGVVLRPTQSLPGEPQ
jgi:lipopolysaccharide export system protein LptA